MKVKGKKKPAGKFSRRWILVSHDRESNPELRFTKPLLYHLTILALCDRKDRNDFYFAKTL
jgi:hypothetical protein